MMKTTVQLLLHCLFFLPLAAQLPKHLNWSVSQASHDFASEPRLINVLDVGFSADGTTNQSMLFNALINENQEPLHLFFPPGDYLFEEPLILRSNIRISGSGPESRWLLNTGEGNDGVIIKGRKTAIATEIPSLASAEEKIQAEVEDGFYYLIDDDSDRIHSGWAKGSTGQFISLLDGKIKPALRRSYHQPELFKVEAVSNVMIEQLTIKRMDETAQQTASILLQYARNCELSCLRLEQSNFALIEISGSAGIAVNGCHLEGAFNYGNGGKAYGVVLQYGSSDCMIENNSFKSLRHAVLLQAGANGNVIGYNYSEKPYWTGVALPSDASGDMVLHGNYPYANLIEGNVLDNLVIDDSHGSNGPWNVFHNNLIRSYGIVMGLSVPTDSQVFASNVVSGKGLFKGLMTLSGSGHLLDDNKVGSRIMSNTSLNFGASGYLTSKPEYFDSEMQWPPVFSGKEPELPALERITGGFSTACESSQILEVETPAGPDLLAVMPNPFSDHLQIRTDCQQLEIFGMDGKRLLLVNGVKKGDLISLDQNQIPAGMVVVYTTNLDGRTQRYRMLHL